MGRRGGGDRRSWDRVPGAAQKIFLVRRRRRRGKTSKVQHRVGDFESDFEKKEIIKKEKIKKKKKK